MPEYKVTVLTLGLGFSSAKTQARKIQEHLEEVSSQGWRLFQADRNYLAIPIYWTFIWERDPQNSGEWQEK
jgi:hypothetical protein